MTTVCIAQAHIWEVYASAHPYLAHPSTDDDIDTHTHTNTPTHTHTHTCINTHTHINTFFLFPCVDDTRGE
jgi:hypothetical protein